MEHAGECNVAAPLGLARDFIGDARHGERFANHLVIADGFGGRIACHNEAVHSLPVETGNTVGAGGCKRGRFTGDRDF